MSKMQNTKSHTLFYHINFVMISR